MIKCPYCGVELEENANFCSLCGEPLVEINKDNLAFISSRTTQRREKIMTDYQKLTGAQKRKIFWKISAMILLSAAIITLIIDLTANQSITWSKYPVTVSLVLLLNIITATFWYKRTILWFSFSFLSTSAMLILLDIYAEGTGWGMKLGIPLLLAAYVIVFMLINRIKAAREKGLNIIAYSLTASGLLSLCIDGIISLYARDSLSFGWGLIVLVSAITISFLLLYIHYRLKKVTDLKRFFHL